MSVCYLKPKRQLLISNQKAILDRNSLLLGFSDKREDKSLRGQKGEGYKIGSLALLRAGCPVSIYNGGEKWECFIDKHPNFDINVLGFKISKNLFSYKNKLLFKIDNISPEEWRDMQINFLNLYCPEKNTILESPTGQVLLHTSLKGRVYCGSIYVDTVKDLQYGYNFNPSELTLNRDRNMLNSFDVMWNTSKMWGYISANRKGQLYNVTDMLKKGIPDVEYIKQFSDYRVTGKIVEEFFEENSERSYPVTSEEESKEVRSLGYKPYYTSTSYASTLRSKLGSIEDLQRRVSMDYTLFQNLTAIDDANIQWVFEVIFSVDHEFKFDLAVAKFDMDTTRSVSERDTLIVNCNLLKCKYDLLHEAIKHYCLKKGEKESMIWKIVYQKTVDGFKPS